MTRFYIFVSMFLWCANATYAAVLTAPASDPPQASSNEYVSTFATYRAFKTQPITPWRQTNDDIAVTPAMGEDDVSEPAPSVSSPPAATGSTSPHHGH